MRKFTLALVATTTATLIASAANAASANGTWVRTSTGGEIEVFACGGGIGMKVTKSADAKKVGKQILCGAKATGANRWEGDLLNLDDGQTYKGVVVVNGATMELSGCVLGGLVCKTDSWKRK